MRRLLCLVVFLCPSALAQEITHLEPIPGWQPRLAPGERLVPGSVRDYAVTATGRSRPIAGQPAPPAKSLPQAAPPATTYVPPQPQAFAAPQAQAFAAPSSSCYSSSYQGSAAYGVAPESAAAYERRPYAVPGPSPYTLVQPAPSYAQPQFRVVPEYTAPAPQRRRGLGRFALRGDIQMDHQVRNRFNIGFGIGDGARRLAARGAFDEPFARSSCGPWGCR